MVLYNIKQYYILLNSIKCYEMVLNNISWWKEIEFDKVIKIKSQ